MKPLMITSFIAITLHCLAQQPVGVWDASILTGTVFDWEDHHQMPSRVIELNLLEQLMKYDRTGYIASDFSDFVSMHRQNIHFIDVDGDGDYDVFYDGVAGGYESGFVDLYHNHAGTLELIHRGLGRIYSLHVADGVIGVQQYPCCDQKLNILRTWMLDLQAWTVQESDTLEVFVGRGEYMGDSILPPSMKRPSPIEFIKGTTTLHWSPNTTDSDVLKVCINDGTNIIMYIPPGMEGEVLWDSPDSRWAFVKIFNTQGLNNLCEGHNKDLKKAAAVMTYGWIKK